MTSNVEKVVRQTQALQPDVKDALATQLMRSVDEPSAEEIEQLWYEEVEDRVSACLEGKMKLIPWEEILRDSRNRLKSKR